MYDIGIVLPMAFPETMKDESKILVALKKIAIDDYFNVVEFGHIENSKIQDEVRKILKSSKLRSSFSGHSLLFSNGLNINSLNEEARKLAVNTLKQGIDEAILNGANSFSFLANNYNKNSLIKHIDALAKSTRELCEYARQYSDMDILLEVFDSEIDKKSLLGPNQRVIEFMEKMNDVDNFGLMLDLSHFPLLNETVEESFHQISDYVKHIHIGNAVVDPGAEGYGDQHPRFGFPNGKNDVKQVVEILNKLNEINYTNKNNVITFEVKPRDYEDIEVVIASSKRTLNKAFSMLKKKEVL